MELRVNLFPIKNTPVPSYVRNVHYWLHRGNSYKILWGLLSQHDLMVQASFPCSNSHLLYSFSPLFWNEKSFFPCSLQSWMLTRRSWVLYTLDNSSSHPWALLCSGRYYLVPSSTIILATVTTQRKWLFSSCVFCCGFLFILWALKNQFAYIAVIPSFVCKPMALCRGFKTTDERRKWMYKAAH